MRHDAGTKDLSAQDLKSRFDALDVGHTGEVSMRERALSAGRCR